jgi:hypothetical protein
MGNFIDNDGYEKEEDHDFGPDASTLQKLRSAWPFLAEPNPTLMDLTRKELTVQCKQYGIPTRNVNKTQLINSLFKIKGTSEGAEASSEEMETSE